MKTGRVLWWAVTLWYCYDDFLAEVMEEPWIGDVHFLIWVVLWFIACEIAEE